MCHSARVASRELSKQIFFSVQLDREVRGDEIIGTTLPTGADELLGLLLDGVGDATIFVLDGEGRVASWNDAAARLFGYAAADILGRPASELKITLDGVSRHGRAEDEGWRQGRDGTQFLGRVVVTALRHDDGALRGYAVVTRDVTERPTRSEEAHARATAAGLSATLLSIGDGVIATDPRGLVTLMNPVAERLTGWTLEEARGRPAEAVFRIVSERTGASVEGPVERVLRNGVIVGLANHTALVGRDGSRRPIADSGAPIRAADGTVLGAVLVFRDVSEQRAQEIALQESEQRFRLLVDSATDYAIFMLDVDGRVASWNRGAQRIKGWTASEIVGQHLSVFYPPEDRPHKAQRELEIARGEGRFEEEGWRIRRDGTRFLANVVLTAIRDADGALRGFAKVTRDVTERVAAEEAARALASERAARAAAEVSERKLAAILATIPDGVTVQDASGRLLYANDAAARACGLPSTSELLATPPTEIFARFTMEDEHGHPFPVERLPGRLALSGLDPDPTLLRVRSLATGDLAWYLLKASPIRDDSGRAVMAVNVWTDVTEEQQEAEVAHFLAEASNLLAAGLDYNVTLDHVVRSTVPVLADWAAVDVVEGDAWRRVAVAHVDPAKIELAHQLQSRYPVDGAAPSGVPQVIRTGRSELYRDITDEMLAAVSVDGEHLRLMRGLGLRSAIIVPLVSRGRSVGALTLVQAESGRSFRERDLSTAEELGRRAATAVDNARLFTEAREAVKLREDFLTIAGHELKTPLSALMLQIASLERAIDKSTLSPAALGERVAKIRRQGTRLDRLINDLLDVARISSQRFPLESEPVDLAGVVAEVLDRFSDELAAAGCELQLSSESVVGTWDRVRIDQLVTNLVANALKYGRGKPIRVEVGGRGTQAELIVRDHGIGISPADQTRIFDRFERAVSARNFGGLGLGLWISKQIVEAHEGTISVASTPEHGATFTVRLPLLAPAQQPSA